eukprot:SAG22_NODE_10039_length_556_cov_1.822757_1_plen_129_part_01
MLLALAGLGAATAAAAAVPADNDNPTLAAPWPHACSSRIHSGAGAGEAAGQSRTVVEPPLEVDQVGGVRSAVGRVQPLIHALHSVRRLLCAPRGPAPLLVQPGRQGRGSVCCGRGMKGLPAPPSPPQGA